MIAIVPTVAIIINYRSCFSPPASLLLLHPSLLLSSSRVQWTSNRKEDIATVFGTHPMFLGVDDWAKRNESTNRSNNPFYWTTQSLRVSFSLCWKVHPPLVDLKRLFIQGDLQVRLNTFKTYQCETHPGLKWDLSWIFIVTDVLTAKTGSGIDNPRDDSSPRSQVI